MKDKKDIFAGIAQAGVSGRKHRLEETMPLPVPEIFFSEYRKESIRIENPSYEENMAAFKAGIESLKNQYAPFLIRHCRENPSERKRQYISDFEFRFSHEKESQRVTIPHYTGPAGRWSAVYTSEFILENQEAGKRTFIVFKGVDYIAEVYLNGRYVGGHEGFFASFEFDATDFLEKSNRLEVIVKNDIPTIGNGDMQVNGDKLYAATGLGWDGPEDGWHHCPAGGGIFDKVYMEERPASYIHDVFVRPDIDSGIANVRIAFVSDNADNSEVRFGLEILPYNFKGDSFTATNEFPCGFGMNYYDIEIPMEGFRLWETENPLLYLISVSTGSDSMEKTFGMRKFHMNDSNEPKGDLYLNNEPILLRGANEMGHLQLCVMRNDYNQLIEDILIAKYCNMNYYRLTQRPVQEEIYHFCDMLGMLCQTDLPLFGYMRKNQFHEGIKQAGEMERHVRNHPSVIMSTYINEPFAPEKYGLSHRHLSRRELEFFFDACDAATYFENPDRVIKRVEGDYDPPTEKGMSDFHCYNMWYTNHALPIGMLYKGYLPALNKGWKTGCGEYGAEGLDNYSVMRKYYPEEWLPKHDDEYWISDRIVKSQTNTMHGDWYEEQDNIRDWIEASQEHQAFATKLMTLAFRRRADRIVSTAVHLLIDAWPSGWMKTLLDVDRVPKKAYFTFKESLEPVKLNLRCDRWTGYSGDELYIEAWVLNDSTRDISGVTLVASLVCNGNPAQNYILEGVNAGACTSIDAGVIKVRLPQVEERTIVNLDSCMLSGGEYISTDRMEITVFPKPEKKTGVYSLGIEAERTVADSPFLFSSGIEDADAVLVSSSLLYENFSGIIPEGKRIVFLTDEEECKSYKINGQEYGFVPIFDPGELGEDGALKGLSFVALSEDMKEHYDGRACSYWYNGDKGFIDHVAEYYIDLKADKLYAFGFEKPSFGKRTEGLKKRLPIMCEKDGNVFMTFETKGRVGVNPVLDCMINDMLTGTMV